MYVNSLGSYQNGNSASSQPETVSRSLRVAPANVSHRLLYDYYFILSNKVLLLIIIRLA
jgi:hypothetical protein